MSKKHKRILAFLIIFILIMYAERTFVVLNHWYNWFVFRETELGDIEIIEYAYRNVSGDLIIPDKIRGKRVTAIGDEAFLLRDRLTSVTIPEGVTSIGDFAFSECDNLTSVTIPDSVTSIGENAFFVCLSLTDVTIPENLISIGDGAFMLCRSLENITIPKNVRIIGDSAFRDCRSLTNVTISNGVKIIDDRAFDGCSSLKNITIPSSVKFIGDGVFNSCSNLKSIIVDPENENYLSDDGVLFNKSKTVLIRYPSANKRKSYTIPNSVEIIADNAFLGCDNLTSVTIQNGVKKIGNNAFDYCDKLSDITIPSSVTSIGDGAFEQFISLKSIIVDPENENYSSDGGVLFNKSKTALIRYPIASARKSYTIPDSVKTIANNAFGYCDKLSAITIPSSVTLIGDGAFGHYTNLKSIIVDPENENYSSDDGVLFNKLKTVLIQYPLADKRKSYTIPDSVETIADNAFWSCNNLTSVTIQNGVKKIGNNAFCYCNELSTITIPSSVTSIGEDAFDTWDLEKIAIYNPECEIDSNGGTICSKTVIYGYKGSTAQAWAKEHDQTFRLIDEYVSD